MKYIPWGIAVLALVLCALMYWRNHSKVAHLEQRAEALREFCVATKGALHDDWRAFTSDDQTKREEAYGRFYEGGAMYHNVSSFMMCTSHRAPTLSLKCRLDKDWGCLGDVAKQMKDLLP